MSAPRRGIEAQPVPVEWGRLLANLHGVMIARDEMKAGRSQAVRDDATVRYGRLCDAIVADLDVLSTRLVLGRITQFLSEGTQP